VQPKQHVRPIAPAPTLYRQLKIIRARTGLDPAQLHKMSPHLAQIDDALADSRAERIQRTSLIYDDAEELNG